MCVTFLFGSGADTDFNEKLKSGQTFAEELLCEKNSKEIKSLIGEDYNERKLIYPSSTKVFLQTIETFPDEAKTALGDEDVKICLKYRKERGKGSGTIDYKDIRNICSGYYNSIISNSEGKEKVREFFLRNAVFFDSLDEKFNSLRNPDFNDNAKRVIWAYATIFIFMIKSIYEVPNDFPWSYEAVFNLLGNGKIPYKPDDNCYYSQLRKSGISYNIVTTNYTSAVETAIKDGNESKDKHKEAVYLHGKLTWFEDLRTFSVYDCTDPKEKNRLLETISNSDSKGGKDKIVPFILIPSGVKPLICTKQIEQFSKFIDCLNDSNRLCVVGYRFNSEDNHINSIIAEWLRKDSNRKMVYFNYDNRVDFSKYSWADDVKRQIESKEIKESDCREKFSAYLSDLKKKEKQ